MDCELEISHRFRSRGRNTMTQNTTQYPTIYGHYPNDVDKDSGNPVHQNLSEKAIRVPEPKTTVLELLTALVIHTETCFSDDDDDENYESEKKRLSRFGIRRGLQYQDKSFSGLDPLEEFVCGEWTWRPLVQYNFT